MSASLSEDSLGLAVRCERCGCPLVPSPSQDESVPATTCVAAPVSVSPNVIDRYQIREKLGSGGFGTVFRAYDPRLDRDVALKILHPEAFGSLLAVERFQREARAMARLHHPHIVPVYDAVQSGPHHFIASALIRGRTLASSIPDGGLAPRRAVRLAIQLVEALAYAHKEGVLHRDVKPSNILIDVHDTLYLMDFGLAGRTEAGGARVTKLGSLLGTPAYMAPEQARGDWERVGPAADLYSVGVVLYEMLTGRLPFEGPPAAVVHQLLQTPPPPPTHYRAGLDGELEVLCLKAIAKHAEDRFVSGQEMAAALRHVLAREESLPTQLETQPAASVPPATLTFGGVGAIGSCQVNAPETVNHTRVQEQLSQSPWWADIVPERSGDGIGTEPKSDGSASPISLSGGDGTGEGTTDVGAARPSGWVDRCGRKTLDIGTELLAFSRRRLKVLSTLAGLLVLLMVGVGFRNQFEELRQLQAQTRQLKEEAERLLSEAEQKEEKRQKEAADQANRFREQQENASAEAARLNQRKVREEAARLRMVKAWAVAATLRVEPEPSGILWSGKVIFLQVKLRRQGYAGEISFKVAGLPGKVHINRPLILHPHQESGKIELVAEADAPNADTQVAVSTILDGIEARQSFALQVRTAILTTHLLPARGGGLGSFCIAPLATLQGNDTSLKAIGFSPNGHVLATASMDQKVRLWSMPDGKLLITLEGIDTGRESISFSPDGHILALGSDEKTVRRWCVPDGELLATLNRNYRAAKSFAIGPDGRILAALKGLASETQLWSMREGKLLASLTGHRYWASCLAFSPDGRFLATGSDDKTARLWSVPTGKPIATLEGHANLWFGGCVNSVAFSPNGRILATASDDRTAQLWSVPEGKHLKTLKGHGGEVTSAVFDPHGRILATSGNDTSVRLWSIPEGNAVATLEGYSRSGNSISFSPDGCMIATRGQYNPQIWSVPDGKLLSKLEGLDKTSGSVVFSPDGRILAVPEGKTARLWLYGAGDRLDWSPGKPALPPEPRVEVVAVDGGIVHAGNSVWLDISVENSGKGGLFQLWAGAEADTVCLRTLGSLIGRIEPGGMVRRRVGVVVPPNHPVGRFNGRLIFHEANGNVPVAKQFTVEVKPAHRPGFSLNWRPVEDNSGRSSGIRDGRIQRGETIHLAVTAENQTGMALEKVYVALRTLSPSRGVVVTGPRTELGNVANRTKARGVVSFRVEKNTPMTQAHFELRLEDAVGRVHTRKPFHLPIE
jgi:WD40 repeat protein/serine/threonine protein kinase